MAQGLLFVDALVGSRYAVAASGVLVAGIVATVGYYSGKRAQAVQADDLLPDNRISLRGFGEILMTLLVALGDRVMGKHNRKYVPFAGTLFFYIFFANLIGLIPGFSMPTLSVAFNAGMAIIVFLVYHTWGIGEVGIKNYVKHFFGGPQLVTPQLIVIGFVVFCIELISHFIRPVTLSLRLFGNMTGDHLVLDAFTELTKFGIPVIFYFFGSFVCFMQAFIFVVLTMVYIRFAVAHEEEH